MRRSTTSSPAARACARCTSGWHSGPLSGLRPDEVFDQLQHGRGADLLREVGAARTQHSRDLTPADGGKRVAAGHQVERLVGERQPRHIGGDDDHHAARPQQPGGQRRVGGPRFRRGHRRRELRGAGEHFAAAGVDVAGGRHAAQSPAHQALIAPRRTLLGRTPVEPGEIPTVHGGRVGLGNQLRECATHGLHSHPKCRSNAVLIVIAGETIEGQHGKVRGGRGGLPQGPSISPPMPGSRAT